MISSNQQINSTIKCLSCGYIYDDRQVTCPACTSFTNTNRTYSTSGSVSPPLTQYEAKIEFKDLTVLTFICTSWIFENQVVRFYNSLLDEFLYVSLSEIKFYRITTYGQSQAGNSVQAIP